MSAHEKAYLEQLERVVATPGRSPYIRRAGPGRQPQSSSAAEPLFDSGPLTADRVDGPHSGANAEAPRSDPLRPSLETPDGHVRLGADGVYEIEIDVPSADLEQEEERRSRKTPPPAQAPFTPESSPQVATKPAPEAPPADETPKPQGMFPCGTLLLWNGNRLAVYKEHLERKGYDLLYDVESGGRLQPKGVCLFAYEPRRVGLLSEGIFRWMEQTMRWERGALICHLDNPDDTKNVPLLSEATPATDPDSASGQVEETPGGEVFVRGRTFTISVGHHRWHGVYWGRDRLGTLVAHNTNRAWSLMHLDLERFGSSVQLGDVLPDGQIREIEAAVNGQG